MAAHPNPRCNKQTLELTSLNLRNPYIREFAFGDLGGRKTG